MAEILYIRLGSQAQDEISWLVFSSIEQEIIASGVLTSAEQLTELTAKAQQRLVNIFVPGNDVLLKRVSMPTKSQRSMRAAVPYMLEEELAQDVDDLFFAYADNASDDDENNCFVAVVERAQMQMWLTWLADAEIKVKTLQSEVLAMPYKQGEWSAIALHSSEKTSGNAVNQVVIRQGEWQGCTLDSEAWKFAAENIFSNQAHSKYPDGDKENNVITLNAYSELPNIQNLASNITVIKDEEELPLALFAQHCQRSPFNLLQGEFKIKEQGSIALTNWLWAAGIALCALLLNVGYKSTQLWQFSAQQEQVEEQIIARYKKTFPSTKKVRIGTIKSQLNKKIAQLGGASDSTGFLSMLSKVQPAFAKVPALKPESLKFDGKRHELRLQAIANDYQHFERFQAVLNSANLAVKQGAQKNQGNQVTGSFSITTKQSSTSKGRS
ncbi:type II secretion system protein GspL [Candidatus Colwellia aromaticivorans]|uniref:type II secretion system protein GspL n=1 Tax=Candidatus Colwellia aromaticivorans TaxID=2267621 RepID=UPI000DF216B7|nr:type II secretion system protein GspL [Candidatus Colwellia aromaticivorans]